MKCIRLLKVRKRDRLSKVVGISISSLCPGLAALDENGKVLVDPIIYSDRRSTEEAEIIKKVVGEDRLFEITANTAMAGAMSGTSMLWIKRNLPEAYEKTNIRTCQYIDGSENVRRICNRLFECILHKSL